MTYRGLMTDSIVQAQRKKLLFLLIGFFISLIKTELFFAADLGPNTVEGGELPRRGATDTDRGEREAVRFEYFK